MQYEETNLFVAYCIHFFSWFYFNTIYKVTTKLQLRDNTEISKSWTIVVNLFLYFLQPPLYNPDHLLWFYCFCLLNCSVCVHTHPVSLFTRQTWKPIKTSVTLWRRPDKTVKQYIYILYNGTILSLSMAYMWMRIFLVP